MSELESGGPGNARRRSIVAGEFVLTSEDMRQIAAMLHADAGIYLTEAKATLVYSRLSKRLRSLGLESFRDYCALVASAEGLDERQKMLAALTTNVTNFYREPHHFEHLAKTVLPPLLDQARRGGRVRIWSAACSNGAEPYTIALTILGLLPEAAGHDIKILATDIDTNMVAHGHQGVYSEAALRPVPAELRRRWFVPLRGQGAAKDWGVADELRQLVAFRELNLIAPSWPMKGRFQAIFCRNVVIYFEEATQARIWSRFVPQLTPGGHLYIGHSERVSGPAAADFQPAGITTYQLKGAGR
ncbi:chemotaxis protein methyltransferase CheR [Mesorhizobium soli]|jgi:chemotaxis protein methyltransferase CheR|uniref:CheR family methyltransferase n=1 Tax=Pseudaminobacter soli (ex Li et al. 2025) TaxID=1295366 RepID=UPI002475EF0F|nr:protein-glutamate O-methyltransferase [Mesorhizobium soli]MDH6235250.1 chemotaxis protein methyltransferase CheR [Mesorhizobium soli]